MTFVPKMPQKVQFLLDFSFPQIAQFCPRKPFVGGRIGHDLELLFLLLLIKKVTNWSYRDIASMGAVSHSTLVRANEKFLKRQVYEKYFVHLEKAAYRKGLITLFRLISFEMLEGLLPRRLPISRIFIPIACQ